MSEKELRGRIAHLEMVNDQLAAEIADVDRLLRDVGFPYGLESVKAVAEEIIELQDDEAA